MSGVFITQNSFTNDAEMRKFFKKAVKLGQDVLHISIVFNPDEVKHIPKYREQLAQDVYDTTLTRLNERYPEVT